MRRARGLPTRFLGSFSGRGDLFLEDENVGTVEYDVEGFADRQGERASGHIEGHASSLRRAFEGGAARLLLPDGSWLALALSEPEGGTAAFRVTGDLPPFK